MKTYEEKLWDWLTKNYPRSKLANRRIYDYVIRLNSQPRKIEFYGMKNGKKVLLGFNRKSPPSYKTMNRDQLLKMIKDLDDQCSRAHHSWLQLENMKSKLIVDHRVTEQELKHWNIWLEIPNPKTQ